MAKKKEINLELVYDLASIMCTQEEIASVLKVTTMTLRKYPGFKEAYAQGRESGKKSLRRAQWDKAVKDGNTTMLIWLGKQYLDQREKTDNINKNEEVIKIVDPFDKVGKDDKK